MTDAKLVGTHRQKPRLRAVAVIAALVGTALVVPWPHPRGQLSGTECARTPFWEWAHEGVAYMWASRLQSTWREANPQTRLALEGHLSLYSMHPIVPSQSCWGSRWTLAPHETMVQYLILWHAPLDVVYDKQDRIRIIFTSYE
jgi:hypothetical protein